MQTICKCDYCGNTVDYAKYDYKCPHCRGTLTARSQSYNPINIELMRPSNIEQDEFLRVIESERQDAIREMNAPRLLKATKQRDNFIEKMIEDMRYG